MLAVLIERSVGGLMTAFRVLYDTCNWSVSRLDFRYDSQGFPGARASAAQIIFRISYRELLASIKGEQDDGGLQVSNPSHLRST